jgi:hypothetical protein
MTDEKKASLTEQLICLFIAILVVTPLRAFIFFKAWMLFIVPIFGVSISYPQALGMMCVWYTLANYKIGKTPAYDSGECLTHIFYYLVVLGGVYLTWFVVRLLEVVNAA